MCVAWENITKRGGIPVKINRKIDSIKYGKINGQLIRIDCPEEKENFIAEAVAAVLIGAGICGWFLFL